jgi:hypothetical protein
MPETVRSSVTTSVALAAATALAVTPLAVQSEQHSLPVLSANISLAAASTPPPGALIEQFLVNQVENCSLICPHIIELAIEPAANFVIIPITFAAELRAGQPLLQAIALTDATVSGAANRALTGIIENDLDLVLPRAQNALEVAVVGLLDIGGTAVTRPGNLLQAIDTARTGLFEALQQPPGTMPPPPVHNVLQRRAVRAIEVTSALTFQVPERALLGVTQAADALFTTLGATGNIGTAVGAVRSSVATTVNDSVGFVRHALTEPIPITSAKAVTAIPKTSLLRAKTNTVDKVGIVEKAGKSAASAQSRSISVKVKPRDAIKKTVKAVQHALGGANGTDHKIVKKTRHQDD